MTVSSHCPLPIHRQISHLWMMLPGRERKYLFQSRSMILFQHTEAVTFKATTAGSNPKYDSASNSKYDSVSILAPLKRCKMKITISNSKYDSVSIPKDDSFIRYDILSPSFDARVVNETFHRCFLPLHVSLQVKRRKQRWERSNVLHPL